MRKERKRSMKRYICPICKREYKKLGWYKRHCENKHTGFLPPKVKKIVDKKDIDHIFHKIESLESKIDTLLSNGIPMQHDIDIKPIRRVQVPIATDEQQKIRLECVRELKELFNQSGKILGKLEDAELGIKTEDEINEILLKKEVVS